MVQVPQGGVRTPEVGHVAEVAVGTHDGHERGTAEGAAHPACEAIRDPGEVDEPHAVGKVPGDGPAGLGPVPGHPPARPAHHGVAVALEERRVRPDRPRSLGREDGAGGMRCEQERST